MSLKSVIIPSFCGFCPAFYSASESYLERKEYLSLIPSSP
ncbi:hypothetical protein CLOM621_08161 [Clostridium sp. M62/1]|nr:hypothetical protein CLOM621_08161 [Clostridium sp. M62/1]